MLEQKQVSIADFYDDTACVTVTHKGRSFNVECYPERATGELAAKAEAVAKAKSVASGQWVYVETVVKSWTLKDEFGEAAFMRMSPGLRMAVIAAVNTEATNPTEAESVKNSGSSSSPAESTDEGRAGTSD